MNALTLSKILSQTWKQIKEIIRCFQYSAGFDLPFTWLFYNSVGAEVIDLCLVEMQIIFVQ